MKQQVEMFIVHLTSGVPQFYIILGPLLFLIYTNTNINYDASSYLVLSKHIMLFCIHVHNNSVLAYILVHKIIIINVIII